MNLLLRITKTFFMAGTLFLAGCGKENICNLTPKMMPQNQSSIYPIVITIRGTGGNVTCKSIEAYVVVNGERHKMEKLSDSTYGCDYCFHDTGKIPYYIELAYRRNRNGNTQEKVIKSDLFYMEIVPKCVVMVIPSRGPVGTSVNILGHGLTQADRVRFGKYMVQANWRSTGAIEFSVPAVKCDAEYEVCLLCPKANRKELVAGTFFVDESMLRCSTGFIRLANGEGQRVVFMLDHPAPINGVKLDVMTDIPDCIIMPEVYIESGARTVSVNIAATEESGQGTLFVHADGFSSLEIPLEVGNVKNFDATSENDSEAGYSQPPQRYSQPSQRISVEDEVSVKNEDSDVVIL
ncbi:MAG: hypothetical protein LBJ13_03630 [Puniceicoccales bacterium]|jgi:hypothetical protein|nr:hypothetical protein [Puniceicoccales bacterium]